MIFSEGEPGDECYIIQKGRVKISIVANNNEKVFIMLKPGDIFGEMALLENKPRSASATAVEDSVMMAVNRGNFEKVVIEQPKMVCRLTELLSERIWANFKQLANTLIRDPQGKLYDALCTELEKNRIDFSSKRPYTFNFGPDSLIKMVGLEKGEGKKSLNKIFQEAKLEIKGDKIFSPDITLIKKSSDYFKKNENRLRSIEASRGKF
jgi:CRP-like cAMP-binding protein